MKKYLIKSVLTATEENPNFAGAVITYWHGKGEKMVASEGNAPLGWEDVKMIPYYVNEYGYNRLCDAKRSWLYKNPETTEYWKASVEIVAVEV